MISGKDRFTADTVDHTSNPGATSQPTERPAAARRSESQASALAALPSRRGLTEVHRDIKWKKLGTEEDIVFEEKFLGSGIDENKRNVINKSLKRIEKTIPEKTTAELESYLAYARQCRDAIAYAIDNTFSFNRCMGWSTPHADSDSVKMQLGCLINSLQGELTKRASLSPPLETPQQKQVRPQTQGRIIEPITVAQPTLAAKQEQKDWFKPLDISQPLGPFITVDLPNQLSKSPLVHADPLLMKGRISNGQFLPEGNPRYVSPHQIHIVQEPGLDPVAPAARDDKRAQRHGALSTSAEEITGVENQSDAMKALQGLRRVGDKLILGRGGAQDINCISFTQSTISSRHAQLIRMSDGVHIYDLGSTNETLILRKDGTQIEVKLNAPNGVLLEDGDTIVLAPYADEPALIRNLAFADALSNPSAPGFAPATMNAATPSHQGTEALPPGKPNGSYIEITPGTEKHRQDNIMGGGPIGIFVRGSDGRIRRFAVDTEGKVPTRGCSKIAGEPISMSLRRQFNYIYDAPRTDVIEMLGEYMLSAANDSVSYQYKGQACERVKGGSERMAAYELSPGKWMIPQAVFRGCTAACVDMLVAEGASRDQVKKLINVEHVDARREIKEYVASLEKKSGRSAWVVECEATEEKFAEILHGNIKKYGPCIYSQGGHVVVVDAVEWPHASSSPVFTVREPFTGAYLKMTGKALRQGAQLRSDNVPYDPNESCPMEAIFLTGEPLPA